MNETVLNIGMYVTYGLIVIAVIAAVIFPIFFFIQDFRKARGTLIGLGILLVVLFFSYAISTNEVYEASNIGPTASQWIGGGITATIILIGLGLLAAVFTEVYKFFR
ncbi:MAG: hypothetical protein R6U86_09895 [Bacteroidales bacterium]